MVSYDNPASRLYNFFSELRDMTADFGITIKDALMHYLKIDNPDDTAQILYGMAELIQLNKILKENILKMDINHEVYLQPIKKIEKTFAGFRLDSKVTDFLSVIDDSTMLGLQFCADTLYRKYGDLVINEEDLNQILQDVEDLSKQIINSDLPERLKELFTENLDAIRKAIINYKIWGTEGLKKTLESNIGSIILNGNLIKEKKENNNILRFFDIIDKLNKLISVGQNATGLIGSTVKLFLGGK